ncbi:hypothetical protein ALC57_07789 [Trachymyrmex cornetzi]|uniref:DNA-directed DNA polymerase n=1 Tax=Trachymyrmex cornetzi TaxID=471704 RepID=A0A151J7Z9_9HYME|nr:hypothetical protein ALC57_07789 [Trachymyrmex cornetzi]
MINFNHIEPRRFLEDAREIVLERVRNAVERHGSTKVNTAFNDEFATKDKRAIKSINTKNIEIYRCTDIRECDKKEKHINVLYLQDPRNDGVGHFAWIKNLSCLVSSQLSRQKNKKFFCDRFIDSFKFLSASLDKLASYLDKDKLKILRSEFSTLSDEKFELLTRKGVFPYEYVDCVEKLQDTRLPGFTWYAMLKPTRVRFELLTDIDMVMFIERGIRGGLSQCSNRYAQANNKYMRSYDSSKPSTYLMYCDVNNLYGWAMCQPLPYAEFQWVKNVANFDVSAITLDSLIGYILEVDLEYPQHLHDVHADLPFCPTCDKPPGKREDKLLATLYNKQRYVIHYRNLQQCTRHGLRVTKIHRVLQFAQSPWLREYIQLNTNFRTRAKNDFVKNLYKLMNNAVFGKTMENVRNHVDVKLLTKWDGRYGAEAMIAKPNFHSLIYRVECEDIYETMKRNIARFDTSDYPMDNAYGMSLANKKVPGFMKDENNGMIMTEFVGLRARMYAVRVDGKKDTKKAKGVKSNVVARTITFDDYTRCLNEEIEMTRRQSCIRSKLHEVYTISESKIALSPYHDKRYVVSDSTEKLPWGHWRIPL